MSSTTPDSSSELVETTLELQSAFEESVEYVEELRLRMSKAADGFERFGEVTQESGYRAGNEFRDSYTGRRND